MSLLTCYMVFTFDKLSMNGIFFIFGSMYWLLLIDTIPKCAVKKLRKNVIIHLKFFNSSENTTYICTKY